MFSWIRNLSIFFITHYSKQLMYFEELVSIICYYKKQKLTMYVTHIISISTYNAWFFSGIESQNKYFFCGIPSISWSSESIRGNLFRKVTFLAFRVGNFTDYFNRLIILTLNRYFSSISGYLYSFCCFLRPEMNWKIFQHRF